MAAGAARSEDGPGLGTRLCGATLMRGDDAEGACTLVEGHPGRHMGIPAALTPDGVSSPPRLERVELRVTLDDRGGSPPLCTTASTRVRPARRWRNLLSQRWDVDTEPLRQPAPVGPSSLGASRAMGAKAQTIGVSGPLELGRPERLGTGGRATGPPMSPNVHPDVEVSLIPVTQRWYNRGRSDFPYILRPPWVELRCRHRTQAGGGGSPSRPEPTFRLDHSIGPPPAGPGRDAPRSNRELSESTRAWDWLRYQEHVGNLPTNPASRRAAIRRRYASRR